MVGAHSDIDASAPQAIAAPTKATAINAAVTRATGGAAECDVFDTLFHMTQNRTPGQRNLLGFGP